MRDKVSVILAAGAAAAVAGMFGEVTAQPAGATPPQPTMQVQIRTDVTSPVMPLRGTLRADIITTPGQFLPGQFADGFLGDFLLENDLVRAVIARPDKKEINAAGGGNLIDIASQKQPIDYINYLQTIGDLETTGGQIRYWTASSPQILEDTTAVVSVQGSFPAGGAEAGATHDIDVTTTYALEKNSSRLRVTTSLTNNTTQTVKVTPGDVMDWGSARSFVPGTGLLGGVHEDPAEYVVGTADDFTLAYVTPGKAALVGLHTPRTSALRAVPRLKETTTAPAVQQPETKGPLRPGGTRPVIVDPDAMLDYYRPVAPALPPGTETRFGAPGLQQPPGAETGFRAPGTQPPGQVETPVLPGNTMQPATTQSALLSPGSVADTDLPRIIPGGDGTRVPEGEAGAQGSTQAESNTTTTIQVERSAEGGQITLAPGQSFVFERELVVADKDFSRAAREVYALKGVTTGTVVGMVLESNTDKPLENVEVLVSGGPQWDRRSPPAAFTKTVSRSDGTYVLHLPVGHYILSPSKMGRLSASGQISVEVTAGAQPRIVPLMMTGESILRVTVTDEDAPTSVPLPAKITFLSKPGTMPVNWGTGPDISKGVGNVYYMPFGAAAIPVTPGRYHVTVSHGIEYDTKQGELTITPGSNTRLDFTLKHSLKGLLPGMISLDAGILTTASAVSTASPVDRVVQAAVEGVQVIVTGDYGVATDLTPVIRQLGFQKQLKAFPGMRLLLERGGFAANLLAYPLTQEKAAAIRKYVDSNPDLPPDVMLADLRKQFPDIILQIDSPVDPQSGYLMNFSFDLLRRRFVDDQMPPPDFDALQVLEGKKWRVYGATFPQLYEMQMQRTRDSGAAPLSGVGSSFSKLAAGEEVGYPRLYLYTRNNTVDTFTAEELVRTIRGQHYVGTNGPVLTVSVLNPKTGAFDVIPGQVVDSSTTEIATVKINVVAAPWVSFSNFEVLFNGQPIDKTEVMPATKVLRYPIQANPETALRRRTVREDIVVQSTAVGLRRPLSPVVQAAPEDFGGEVHPFAWTGPIFLDKEGDGRVILTPRRPEIRDDAAETTETAPASAGETQLPSGTAPAAGIVE